MSLKQLLLNEFTEVLYKHDPMKLKVQSFDEYEAEALSILSRFTEASLQLADDEQAIVDFATSTVQQTFEFWFGKQIPDNVDLNPVTMELLKKYIDAYPTEEQVMKEALIQQDKERSPDG